MQTQNVPYGYEPRPERNTGTLIYYDIFEDTSNEELDAVADTADGRTFAKLVLYPIHEETAKRMFKFPVSPYYKREKHLREWMLDRASDKTTIDGWEGKRKKYTPIDAALRHLTETLPSPHFLYLTPEMANTFASFSSFEEWIVRIRMLLTAEPVALHPRLERFRNRWDVR
ncbi:hypothetical protein D7Z26_04780 [Cohnella endophytica]|uniref:Uncharacterized protein n=1 Tax=Cohnella endophytica TaxID=2419778 RepID=A0A494YAI4_9BACL|nr:hypothetical protein [Cohnella endophytica]RKP57298.1 hypothetical protein D7Z26_04780 [Cohnella endophytica]